MRCRSPHPRWSGPQGPAKQGLGCHRHTTAKQSEQPGSHHSLHHLMSFRADISHLALSAGDPSNNESYLTIPTKHWTWQHPLLRTALDADPQYWTTVPRRARQAGKRVLLAKKQDPTNLLPRPVRHPKGAGPDAKYAGRTAPLLANKTRSLSRQAGWGRSIVTNSEGE